MQFHQLAQWVESWRLYQPRNITHNIIPRSVHANGWVRNAAGMLSAENMERCLNPWNCAENKTDYCRLSLGGFYILKLLMIRSLGKHVWQWWMVETLALEIPSWKNCFREGQWSDSSLWAREYVSSTSHSLTLYDTMLLDAGSKKMKKIRPKGPSHRVAQHAHLRRHLLLVRDPILGDENFCVEENVHSMN